MADLLNRNVICSVCKKEVSMRAISQHLRMHGIEYIDYIKNHREDFPNWYECPICGELTKRIRTCSRECDRKFRQSQTGEKSHRYGVKLSDESKNKISKSRKKQGNFWKGKKHSKEAKKRMSDTRIERRLSEGKNNGMYGKTHTPEAIKKIFSHRKMNKLEKLVAKVLKDNGYKYTFQFFITEDMICKSYDFKLKGLPIIIEVDGDFWHGNPLIENHWKDVDKVQENDKLKKDMALKRGYKVIRIWESELKKDVNILLNRIKNCV